ncbi:MAG: NUDIX hydrolase [Patescibacteria group bacterium]
MINLGEVPTDDLCREIRKRGIAMGEMSFEQFIMTISITPVACVELCIRNTDNEILLIWRDDADFHANHFPGSLVHMFENLTATCRRIALKETGVAIRNIFFAGVHNYNDPKSDIRHCDDGQEVANHFIGLVFVADIEPSETPKNGKFFKQVPADILVSHREVWKISSDFLVKGKSQVINQE